MPLPDLHFHARGKLLLTGEYAVLDGALALALPTTPGQKLHARAMLPEADAPVLSWTSYDNTGQSWFSGQFTLPQGQPLKTTDSEVSNRLVQILSAAAAQNPHIWQEAYSWELSTFLEFPRLWGLGTSSTLLANLAQWLQLNPYRLLDDTFGGSGYDLACALASGPLLYSRAASEEPRVQAVDFHPAFSTQLYFVYLGHKQNSREGIQRYRNLAAEKKRLVAAVTELTLAALQAQQLPDFEEILLAHEQIISQALQLPRAHDLYFKDYWGITKSLGAWGGDFVLATSQASAAQTIAYFNTKGFEVVIPYMQLIAK